MQLKSAQLFIYTVLQCPACPARWLVQNQPPCSSLSYGGAEHCPDSVTPACHCWTGSWRSPEPQLLPGVPSRHYMFECVRCVRHPPLPPVPTHHHVVIVDSSAPLSVCRTYSRRYPSCLLRSASLNLPNVPTGDIQCLDSPDRRPTNNNAITAHF